MYTHFYGFSEEPFRDTPDLRFLFAGSDRQRAIGSLIQGIEEKSGWTTLIGDPGSGKTILIHYLLESLKAKDAVKTAFIFQARISFEDLLRKILIELNLPLLSASGTEFAEHFLRSVLQILTPENTLIVFLDEAQDFDVEVLGKIADFFGNDFQRPEQIHIIFSGQPLLAEKLRAEALHRLTQRIAFRCFLRPFTAPESRQYLDHRLRIAGGNSDRITPEALNLIIRHGEGIPRTINILCDNAFRIAHRFSEPNISAKIVRKALGEMYP